MIVVDKLCYGSKLRYVSPYEKFAFAMLTLIFCIVSRSIVLGLFVMAVNYYLTVVKGGIASRRYNKLMLIPLTFLILSTIAIIVNFSRTPLDAFALPIGSIYITGSWASILHGVQLIVTAMAAVSCLYFLSLNTTMTDILSVLEGMKCPTLIVELMMLIYRFIFVLMDTASSISTSQSSRLGHKDFKTSLKSFSALVQTLFVRSMKRSSLLYDAMEARCYDGQVKVIKESHKYSKKNVIMIVVFELILLAYTICFKQGIINLI